MPNQRQVQQASGVRSAANSQPPMQASRNQNAGSGDANNTGSGRVSELTQQVCNVLYVNHYLEKAFL